MLLSVDITIYILIFIEIGISCLYPLNLFWNVCATYRKKQRHFLKFSLENDFYLNLYVTTSFKTHLILSLYTFGHVYIMISTFKNTQTVEPVVSGLWINIYFIILVFAWLTKTCLKLYQTMTQVLYLNKYKKLWG